MNSYDYKSIAEEIYLNGYVELSDFLSPEDYRYLYDTVQSTKWSSSLSRDADHDLYKFVLSDRISPFFMKLAEARLKYVDGVDNPTLIPLNQFAISIGRKGPTFGNAKMHKLAFHYDDSFVNAVFALDMPKGIGRGLMIYKNLKKRFGMGLVAKVVSRLVGRISFLRKIIKPSFVRYVPGRVYVFYGDYTLHGVGDCSDGDRVNFAVNLSRVTHEAFAIKRQNLQLGEKNYASLD